MNICPGTENCHIYRRLGDAACSVCFYRFLDEQQQPPATTTAVTDDARLRTLDRHYAKVLQEIVAKKTA